MYSIKWALKHKHEISMYNWTSKNALADKYIVLTFHVSYDLFQRKTIK